MHALVAIGASPHRHGWKHLNIGPLALSSALLALLFGVIAALAVAGFLAKRGYADAGNSLYMALGIGLLGAWASPLPQIRFCPTGGISLSSAPDFLALPNVLCVGGSWLTPAGKLAAGDWAGIEWLAREAASLRRTD